MASPARGRGPGSRRITPDRWLAIVCLGIAGLIIAAMPSQTSDRAIAGARGFDLLTGAFFPKLAVIVFVLAALWLFIEGRPGRTDPADAPPGLSVRNLLYASILTAGVLVYVQLLGLLGYIISTIIAVTALALLLGQRSWLGLLVGAVLFPLVVYYAFAHIFMVPLPRSDLW
jgi:putative tricarboxylic transport membrane protein